MPGRERLGGTQIQHERVLVHEPDDILRAQRHERLLACIELVHRGHDRREHEKAAEVGMMADVFEEPIHSGTTACTQRARIIELVGDDALLGKC